MEISLSALVDFSIQLSIYALIPGVFGAIIVGIDKPIRKGKFNLREGESITKVGMIGILLAKLGLIIALTGFAFAGLWWLWESFYEGMTPARLALYSLVIGPTPFLLPLLAKIICKLTGGTVDVSQVQGCYFLGMNLNNFVYTLFMSYMLVILTGGLAVFGLMSSGVWALVNFLI